MDKTNPLVKSLLDTHPEFRQLLAEHDELETKLAELDRQHYLTPEQEIERKRLQKIKLHGKDRMEQILHQAPRP